MICETHDHIWSWVFALHGNRYAQQRSYNAQHRDYSTFAFFVEPCFVREKKTTLHSEGWMNCLFIEGRGNRLGDFLQAPLTAGEHVGGFGLDVTEIGRAHV